MYKFTRSLRLRHQNDLGHRSLRLLRDIIKAESLEGMILCACGLTTYKIARPCAIGSSTKPAVRNSVIACASGQHSAAPIWLPGKHEHSWSD